MFKRLFFACLALVPSYFIGLGVGILLISVFSPNRHDVTVEAATMGGLFFGPLAGIVGFVVTFVLTKPKPPEQ